MLIEFFLTLRRARLPVSLNEFLLLLEAMHKEVIAPSIDAFYYLSRITLIKDETNYDKFDKAFGQYFNGMDTHFAAMSDIPLDWLIQHVRQVLSPEQRTVVEKFGYEKLLGRLQEVLREQQDRHTGGNKWIGTGGTSQFGNGGYNSEGIRIGGRGEHRHAVKVWDERIFQDYDGERELGTRNIKVALRRLRRFARGGTHEELALDDTIRATANNAGYLDIRM